MTSGISRQYGYKELLIDISEDDDLTSSAIDMRDVAGGMLQMPAAWDAADIEFMVSHVESGPYYGVYDHDDAQLKLTTPSVDRWYELPPELYGAHWVKLATSAAQTADRTIIVILKG